MTSVIDTIAAVATPAGAGGVGVVRISGPGVPKIASALLEKIPIPRYAQYTAFRDAEGLVLDRGLALYFPQPHSFTGEHVLELHAHGNPVLLQLLLKRVTGLGARIARPGEFSERAFLNNKLDLAQAEAIADLIASQSEIAVRAALRSLEGEFSNKVHKLLDALIGLRVYIEAAIDFPEEEIDFLATPQLLIDIGALQTQLAELLMATRRGVILRDGLHVVIVGRPNVGKSSLLNALTQSDRAIVTPIAGTTRDILRETVQLDGIALTLVDTAGLRKARDEVEAEGIRRAYIELSRADVMILVTDTVNAEADRVLLAQAPITIIPLIVYNKIDLMELQPHCEKMQSGEIQIWLSARTGIGLELLRTELKSLAGHGESDNGAFSARNRHVEALEQAAISLSSAEQALRMSRAGELAAEELRMAQCALDRITGKFGADDLLGAIFSTFCIGK